MKKLICVVMLFAGALSAQLAVPPGAVMETTVKATVPVAGIKITRLVCDLSQTNGAASYSVSFDLIDGSGRKVPKTVRVSQSQAEQMMAATGYSLTNLVGSALGAIQIMVNQQFGQ